MHAYVWLSTCTAHLKLSYTPVQNGLPWCFRHKESACRSETWVQSLGWEDPLEEVMVTHSRILAWRIPWTESLAGYSPWDLKVLDMTE